ncbi:hypothetical protein EYF80_012652 [Liparis tanakae]|uniref:Uncharacterized protein n=1 Tax=Liparis tanakae TaxID=230148 RepID=A0A4Z2IHT5_9TELE|nr:hypothetical protein EYF80_012652 [Liparis tanakae]
MGGVKTELLGGRGLRAGQDEELDSGRVVALLGLLNFSILKATEGRGQKHRIRCCSITGHSAAYLLSKALPEFVSRGRLALGFLGQLSSGFVSARVEPSRIRNDRLHKDSQFFQTLVSSNTHSYDTNAQTLIS